MRDSVGYGAFQKRLRLTLCFMSLRQLTFVAPSKCPHQPQLRLTAQFRWFRHFGGRLRRVSPLRNLQVSAYVPLSKPFSTNPLGAVKSSFGFYRPWICRIFYFQGLAKSRVISFKWRREYPFLKEKFRSRFNWVKNFHSSQPRQKISPESPKWFYGFKKN